MPGRHYPAQQNKPAFRRFVRINVLGGEHARLVGLGGGYKTSGAERHVEIYPPYQAKGHIGTTASLAL